MKKYVILAVLVSIVSFAQDFAMPETPWFDHVTTPSTASHKELCELASKLYAAIKLQESPAKIAALAPNDPNPRAVFITIGGNDWPGRTYFGTGFSFAAALQTAADILKANEPVFAKETAKLAKATIEDAAKEGKRPAQEWVARLNAPGEWNWLRLDVVQVAKPAFGFSVDRSRIALTSLVGLSFGPQVGFAFTPEQLTARCLINESRHIAKQQVCNLISETYNWTALKSWMKLSAVDAGHRICLFETDSFYTDGDNAVRLYRGHSLKDLPPNAEECLSMAMKCADRLISRLEPGTGKFSSPFPAWYPTGADGDESFDALAEFAIALTRLGKGTGKQEYINAALLTILPILKSISPFGSGKQASVVVETEELPKDSLLDPRKISTLRTNALTCLSLLELKAAGKDTEYGLLKLASRIGLHIRKQIAPGGILYSGIILPSGKLMTDDRKNHFAQIEDSALAALALARLGTDTNDASCTEASREILKELFVQKVVKLPMQSLTLSPWIAEALTYAGRKDKEFVLQMIKIGYAASADMDTSPLHPDYFGAARQYPSCTLSAERSWLLGNISKWLRMNQKHTLAGEQLAAALPIMLFQTQALIDKAASSVLPSPSAYTWYFRDNLEDYGFELPGQTAQIMSLVTIAGELKEQEKPSLKKVLTQLTQARLESDIHPGPISVNLVSTQVVTDNSDNRNLLGGFEKKGPVKFRGRSGKAARQTNPDTKAKQKTGKNK